MREHQHENKTDLGQLSVKQKHSTLPKKLMISDGPSWIWGLETWIEYKGACQCLIHCFLHDPVYPSACFIIIIGNYISNQGLVAWVNLFFGAVLLEFLDFCWSIRSIIRCAIQIKVNWNEIGMYNWQDRFEPIEKIPGLQPRSQVLDFGSFDLFVPWTRSTLT